MSRSTAAVIYVNLFARVCTQLISNSFSSPGNARFESQLPALYSVQRSRQQVQKQHPLDILNLTNRLHVWTSKAELFSSSNCKE